MGKHLGLAQRVLIWNYYGSKGENPSIYFDKSICQPIRRASECAFYKRDKEEQVA